MGKKFMVFLFILALGMTIGVIVLMADVTIKQYEDTKEWQDTKIEGKLKDVPPFLAKNYVDKNDKKAVDIFNSVDSWIVKASSGSLTEKEKGTARKTVKKAEKMRKKYGLSDDSGISYAIARLSVYLDIEDAMASAYDSPEAEPLKALSLRLYDISIKDPKESDAAYFARMNEVAGDYASLASFLSDIYPKLGSVENGMLIVPTHVTQEIGDEILAETRGSTLERFPFIQKLQEKLSGNDWELAMRRGELARDYQAWKDVEQSLNSVSKSQFWQVSSITTMQQAQDMGLFVVTDEREGYTIDPASPVECIIKDGSVLSPEQYVRYGTQVEVAIQENYIEIEIPEVLEDLDDEDSEEEKDEEDNEEDGEDGTDDGLEDSEDNSDMPIEPENIWQPEEGLEENRDDVG